MSNTIALFVIAGLQIATAVINYFGHTRADGKLNHITVLTNSTLTAANERIKVLEETIKNAVTITVAKKG